MKKIVSYFAIAAMVLGIITGCAPQKEVEELFDVKTIDKKLAINAVQGKTLNLLDEPYTVRKFTHNSMVNHYGAIPNGGVNKEALCVHPVSTTEQVMVDYTVDLTDAAEGSLVVFSFYTGFIDNGNTPSTVEYTILINDQVVNQTKSNKLVWQNHVVDLSDYAGQSVTLTLATRGVDGTAYAAATFADMFISMMQESMGHVMGIGGGDVAEHYAFSLNGHGSIREGIFTGTGAASIDSQTFDAGRYFLKAEIEGDGEVKVFAGSNLPEESITYEQDGKRYVMVLIKDAVQKVDDWEIALGHPMESIDYHPYDYVEKQERELNLEFSGNAYTVVSLELWRTPSLPVLAEMVTADYRPSDNDDAIVRVTLQNPSVGALLRDDGFSLKINVGKKNGKLKEKDEIRLIDLASQSSATYELNAGKLKPGEYVAELYFSDGDLKWSLGNLEFIVTEAVDGEKNPWISNDIYTVVGDKNLEINELYVYNQNRLLIGTIPMPELSVEENVFIRPENYLVSQKNDTSMELEGVTDEYTVKIQVELDSANIHLGVSVQAKRDLSLYYFEGPAFLMGNKSFGDHKTGAIFPGVDYLSTEKSNNALAVSEMEADRFAPNPVVVTFPMMTMATDEGSMVLKWDAEQEWTEGLAGYIRPRFEAPSLNGADYSYMGLFGPCNEKKIKENQKTQDPLSLKSGQSVSLKATLEWMGDKDASESVFEYVSRMQLEEPTPLNKEQEDVLKLLLEGHIREQKGEEGWITFIDSSPAPSVLTESLHNLIGVQFMLDSESAQKAAALLNSVKMPNASIEWAYADSIWLRMEKDYTNALLSSAIGTGNGLLNGQNADGVWPDTPKSNTDKLFMRQGDVTMGNIGAKAATLAKAYLITGDETYLAGVKKALVAMDSMTKPAGAGPWELPNSNADTLAAALALETCRLVYDQTQDPEVLRMAVKFAKQVLPFIYLQEVPYRVPTLYAFIPSFGATNYIRPWQGSPVMWQGAIIASQYEWLYQYDQSLEWATISKGIMNQCINLINEDKLPGRFPDAFDIPKLSAKIVDNIWANGAGRYVQEQAGYQGGMDAVDVDGIRLVSGYEILSTQKIAGGLTAKIKIPVGMPCYVIVMSDTLSAVQSNGVELTEQAALDNVTEGYRKLDSGKGYAVKLRGSIDEMDLNFNF